MFPWVPVTFHTTPFHDMPSPPSIPMPYICKLWDVQPPHHLVACAYDCISGCAWPFLNRPLFHTLSSWTLNNCVVWQAFCHLPCATFTHMPAACNTFPFTLPHALVLTQLPCYSWSALCVVSPVPILPSILVCLCLVLLPSCLLWVVDMWSVISSTTTLFLVGLLPWICLPMPALPPFHCVGCVL